MAKRAGGLVVTAVPPRLHVIPATGSDKALVLRRGPADKVATLLWDRATDAFVMGQWLAGRIYEHRADVSPDGRHLVYFAGNGRRWWTALSRAPHLRAIAFYPQDSTWQGGGAFDATGRLWLNGVAREEVSLPDGLQAAKVGAFPTATDGFHMGDLVAAKMQMRGWSHVSGTGYDLCLRKSLRAGWALEMTIKSGARNRALLSNSYALVSESAVTRLERPDWEWAELYGQELQYAQHGALYRARMAKDGGLRDERLIRDLSDMTFEKIKAPYEGVSDWERAK